MKINVEADCGNAPKKEFLKDVNIAFAKGNSEFLTKSVTDKIIWDKVGDIKIEGIKKFSEELNRGNDQEVSELTLDRILTHGREGAVSGTIKLQNGKKIAFSDFYKFSGAKGDKIKSIVSYVIKL